MNEGEILLKQVQVLTGLGRLSASARLVGPIVLLNVFLRQGDALFVADLDEPVHVPLPDINDRHVPPSW